MLTVRSVLWFFSMVLDEFMAHFDPLPLELLKLEMMADLLGFAGRGSKDDGRCALVAVPALFQWLSHEKGS